MAKRKRSAALFEVFHAQRQAPVRSAASSRAGRWWFRSKEEPAEKVAIDPNDPTSRPLASPLLAPRLAALEPQPAVAVAAPAVRTVEHQSDKQLSPETDEDAPARAISFTDDRRELLIRMRTSSAVITAFGLMVALGLAYVLGRHAGSNEADSQNPVADNNTVIVDDPHTKVIQAKALDVPRRPAKPSATPAFYPPPVADDQPREPRESHARDRENAPSANDVNGISPVTPNETAVADGPRVIGLNYVLVGTYPTMAGATEARDFLVKNGIRCTIEKAPPGFSVDPSWLGVISTRGFERVHTPECEAFKRQIEKVGEKFATKQQLKRFTPVLFKLK